MRRQVFLLALAVILVSLVLPDSAAAQHPPCRTGCGNNPPWLELAAPATSPFYTPTPYTEIHFCKNSVVLDPSTIQIKLNGVDVTSSFSVSSGDPGGLCGGSPSVDYYATSSSVTWRVGADTLYANVCDDNVLCGNQSWYFTLASPGTATLALRNQNGDNIDRGLCMTLGAGSAAGLSCGDLFVSHAMPAYRTMGRDRSLTLLYNSATAAPRPAVAVWITEPTNVQTPTTVWVRLQVNGVGRDSASFSGFSLATRQVVLAYDAKDDTTGIYPFTVLVRNNYSGGPQDTTITGELLVYNRSQSEFGAGWGLEGVERIVGSSGGRKLLLDGDGSIAVYDTAGTNRWIRHSGEYLDTLIFSTSTHLYTRTLRHNIRVVFDSLGRHYQTINRVGHTTQFTWGAPPGYSSFSRLLSVTVPSAGSSANVYSLTYQGASQYIDEITDPAGRVLTPSVSTAIDVGSGLGTRYAVASIKDPDSLETQFTYDAVGRIVRRTNRAGYGTGYLYGDSLHVTRVRVPLTSASGDSATSTITWWNARGLAYASPGGTLTAIDTVTSYTFFDGPRTDSADVASFWVDRWGAPVRIVGPVNDTTLLTRSTSTGLVSRLENPVHNVVGMTWNSRGNLLTQTDSTHEGHGTGGGFQNATTRYTYHDTRSVDSPDSVIDPDTVVGRYIYDSLGLDSIAISSTGQQTRFLYGTGGQLGLLTSVTDLQVSTIYTDTTNGAAPADSNRDQTTSFSYDSLGNATTTISPKGAKTRVHFNGYTQVDSVINAVGKVTVYYPRPMGVVDSVRQISASGNRLYKTYYDSLFNRTQFTDPRGVTRSWEYDLAGRDTAEVDDYGIAERRFFGPSGLLDSVRTRRHPTSDTTRTVVHHFYDPAGRLTRTWFPPLAGSDTAYGDTILNTYDAAGHLLRVVNRNDTVTRQYYREGTLKQEQQRNVTSDMNAIMQYRYSHADRRTSYYDFGAMSGSHDTIQVTYSYTNGLPSQEIVRYPSTVRSDTVGYSWDGLGRRKQEVAPNHVTLNWYYDMDGLLRRLKSSHTCGGGGCPTHDSAAIDQIFAAYDSAGRPHSSILKVADAGYSYIDSMAYDDFGQVSWQLLGGNPRNFSYDLSGNMLRSIEVSTSSGKSFVMSSGHNRMQKDSTVASGTGIFHASYVYSGAGDRMLDSAISTAPTDIRVMFYDALGRMTSIQSVSTFTSSTQNPQDVDDVSSTVTGNQTALSLTTVWNHNVCRFDGLGRRIRSCDGLPVAYDGDRPVRIMGARIVYGPGLDEPIAILDSALGATSMYPYHFYFLTDGRGGLLSFVDSLGVDARQAGWADTYNQKAMLGGASARPQSFATSGREANSAPELSFYRNRYYDQRTGRWTQEDPAGVDAGANLYAYVGNNPATFSDPFGLCPPKDSSPCGLSDLLDFTVTIGGQIDAAVTVGGVGAYVHGQIGPTVGVNLNNTHPSGDLAEPVSTPSQLSVGGGVQGLGQRAGVTCSFSGGCQTDLPSGTKDASPTSESVQRSRGGTSTKLSVAVGIGIELGVNPQAVKQIAGRVWDSITSIF